MISIFIHSSILGYNEFDHFDKIGASQWKWMQNSGFESIEINTKKWTQKKL
jgi:hypothetical protein